MRKTGVFICFILVVQGAILAQFSGKNKSTKDSISSQQFIATVEQALEAFYADYAKDPNYDSIMKALEYEPKEIPEFTDAQICSQLGLMNEMSPFHLECNESTLSVIRFFAAKRRSFIRIAMGRSQLYFDLYEEALDRHGLPLELKYLSVIESGLRPQVKSRAGALGLWQFMYGTGKMFDLDENSYIDERMDPAKATDAACRYLKKLYGIYGDWNLALAAYNAGPGNINKAIRRSGGKLTYWEIRPFLPRETQGYVPNFIAAAYLMTYHKENNLIPMEAKVHRSKLDTMCLKSGVHMESISKLVDWPLEDIKGFNPVYKRDYIPKTEPKQCITGPLSKIGKLVAFEDSLYVIEQGGYSSSGSVVEKASTKQEDDGTDTKFIYHTVRKGETIHRIASKHGVTTQEIMRWNNMRSTNLIAGKKLKISHSNGSDNAHEVKDSIMGTVYSDSLIQIEHVVQRNESLEVLSKIYKVSAADIKKWNKLTDNWINIGQTLIINTKISVAKPGLVLNEQKAEQEAKIAAEKAKTQPSESKKYYTIRSGDLFNRIAQRHKLTSAELKKLNPGVNPDRIQVGQRLRVR